MAKYMAVLLDDKRMDAVKGSGLEDKIDKMFGGALNAFTLEISDEKSKEILDTYFTARIDSRGFITDVPIAFNRILFEEISKTKSLGTDEIKEAAAKESEYLPAPEI
ncbi:MAG: hypothetical protein JRJ42_10910 [Deltaproteobacteria bacterium]|nr:hypothetical protein [Deltaproteobacteria bacterium]